MRRTKGKKSLLLALALLLIVGATSSYVAVTFAKYTGNIERTGTMQVAKWSFEEDNKDSALTVDLSETYDATTLVANKIAPGTKGSFAIKLVNDNSETGVKFAVKLGTIENMPANMKFYKDAAMSTELTADGITGILKANDATGVDIKIYWQWAYETGTGTEAITAGDTADTTSGKVATALSIPVTISGVQYQPNGTAIETKID